MKCNCISEVTAAVKEKLINEPKYKKPIKNVEIGGVGFAFDKNDTLISRTFNNFEIELEGQKKTEKLAIFHSFCPFCGIKNNEN